MHKHRILGITTALLTLGFANPVLAAGPAEDGSDEGEADSTDDEGSDDGAGAEASGGFSLSTDSGVEGNAEGSARGGNKDDKWINRWAPTKGMGEVGIYGGLFIPSKNHELYDDSLFAPDFGSRHDYRSLNADIGLRAGYYPARFLGVEGEFGVMPVGIDGGGSGIAYTARAHAIAQLARWSITPFALAGVGMLGVSSDEDAANLGKDIDFGLHFGVGAKFYINRSFMVRLDLRDIVSNKAGADDPFGANHLEVLLGLSYTFGRKKQAAPEGPNDSDGDGIMDPDDKCVDVPGVAEYDGCPIPDTDGDGILDPDDKCVDEPGTAEYEGCPVPDTDGDGILDPDDKCVDEPENKNDYQDSDGCPDEIPQAVKAFTGVIEGIYFDTNKDTIKPNSERILKKALKVLKDFPEVRLKISGHTDSRGDDDHNMDLSKRRAASVKSWFEGHGLDGSRFETDGYGPTQPIDSNETKAGRAKNRRIEFSLLN
jgi:outer membrane protein OmpA-like peptidoglycan-associated protein